MFIILLESLNPVSIKLTSHHLLSTLLVNTVCVSRKRVFQTFRQPDKPGSQDENWNRNWNWKLVKPRHENRNIDRNRDRNWTTQVKTSEPGCWDSPTCTARLRQGIKSLKKKNSEILLQGLTKIADLSVCSNITVLYLYSNKITRIGWLSVIKKIFTNTFVKQKQTNKQNRFLSDALVTAPHIQMLYLQGNMISKWAHITLTKYLSGKIYSNLLE